MIQLVPKKLFSLEDSLVFNYKLPLKENINPLIHNKIPFTKRRLSLASKMKFPILQPLSLSRKKLSNSTDVKKYYHLINSLTSPSALRNPQRLLTSGQNPMQSLSGETLLSSHQTSKAYQRRYRNAEINSVRRDLKAFATVKN